MAFPKIIFVILDKINYFWKKIRNWFREFFQVDNTLPAKEGLKIKADFTIEEQRQTTEPTKTEQAEIKPQGKLNKAFLIKRKKLKRIAKAKESKILAFQNEIKQEKHLEAQAQKESKEEFLKDLCGAIEENNIKNAKKLIKHHRVKLPIQLLAVCLIRNQVEIAKLLITRIDKDLNVVSVHENNAFLNSMESCSVPGTYIIFKNDVPQEMIRNISLAKESRYSSFFEKALLYATTNGHVDTVKFLLKQNVKINYTSQIIESLPLEPSSQYHSNSKKILDIFFKKKIKINYDQGKAISYAVQSGAVNAIGYILKDAALSERNDSRYRIYDMWTCMTPAWFNKGTSSNAIEYAIKEHQPKVAEFLLMYFKEHNTTKRDYSYKHQKMRSTNVLCASYSNSRTFHYALQHGEMGIAKILLPYLKAEKLNKHRKAEHEKHRTALFYAVKKQDPEMVQLLLDKGANYGPAPYPGADIKIIEDFYNTFKQNVFTPLLALGLSRDTADIICAYLTPQGPALEDPHSEPPAPTSPKKK